MDTNKMREISREQFEEWYSAIVCCGVNVLRDSRTSEGGEGFPYRINGLDGEPDFEVSEPASIAWLAWQASREAVVVELPNRAAEACREEFDDLEGGSFNEAAYIRDVRKVIEAVGLKVAP